MAIQGTHALMYINTHCFCIFFIFQFFYMKKKMKTEKKTNKNKLNKAMHKTRLTQNINAKHISNAKTKTKRGERE